MVAQLGRGVLDRDRIGRSSDPRRAPAPEHSGASVVGGTGAPAQETPMRTVILWSGLAAATLLPRAGLAQEQAYCLESPAGARTCVYDSLERCQQMAGVRTVGGRCVMNPARFGTTGQGGMDAPRGSGPHSLDRTPAPVR